MLFLYSLGSVESKSEEICADSSNEGRSEHRESGSYFTQRVLLWVFQVSTRPQLWFIVLDETIWSPLILPEWSVNCWFDSIRFRRISWIWICLCWFTESRGGKQDVLVKLGCKRNYGPDRGNRLNNHYWRVCRKTQSSASWPATPSPISFLTTETFSPHFNTPNGKSKRLCGSRYCMFQSYVRIACPLLWAWSIMGRGKLGPRVYGNKEIRA